MFKNNILYRVKLTLTIDMINDNRFDIINVARRCIF